MSEADQPTTKKQNRLTWEGLQVFRKLTEWITTARDSERLCAAFFEALAVFLPLNAWLNSKVRETNYDISLLEHFVLARQILNPK